MTRYKWTTGNLFSNIGRGRHKIRRNTMWNRLYYLNGYNHRTGRWRKNRQENW